MFEQGIYDTDQTINCAMQTIILGLGNELLGDEGVGVHAARLLQRLKLPMDTKVIEVGTAILNSVSEWEGGRTESSSWMP